MGKVKYICSKYMIYWKNLDFKKIVYSEFKSIKDFKGQQDMSKTIDSKPDIKYQFESQNPNDKDKIKSRLFCILHFYTMSNIHLEICTHIHTATQMYKLMVTEKSI